jgi:hypothetical protein
MYCSFCHREFIAAKIHIRDECPSCGRDLHICLNCAFYDANAYRQCRESIREPVHDKDRANYCDFFRGSEGEKAAEDSESQARKKLNGLFK